MDSFRHDGLVFDVRDAGRDRLFRGARILSCGCPLTISGGHTRQLGGEVDGEEALRQAVRRLVGAGADFVKVMATGMCHTDMVAGDQLYEVPMPIVLGHEGAGIVEQIGSSVKKLAIGDHVVLTYMWCGHCRPCLRGDLTYCENFYPLNFGGAREDSGRWRSRR